MFLRLCTAVLALLVLAGCQSPTSQKPGTAPDGDVPTPAPAPSPWAEAAARGVVIRAVGNEPGWFVEVDNGDMPPLRATLDYGERRIEVASTVSLSSSHGFGGKLADGTDVVLRIKHEPCNDGMSGEAFEASAVLTVGDKQYQGCGAYLSD